VEVQVGGHRRHRRLGHVEDDAVLNVVGLIVPESRPCWVGNGGSWSAASWTSTSIRAYFVHRFEDWLAIGEQRVEEVVPDGTGEVPVVGRLGPLRDAARESRDAVDVDRVQGHCSNPSSGSG